jgi:hypothetical protein
MLTKHLQILVPKNLHHVVAVATGSAKQFAHRKSGPNPGPVQISIPDPVPLNRYKLGFQAGNVTSSVTNQIYKAKNFTKLNNHHLQDARGLDICFGYNNARGCRRTVIDATTCKDPISQTQYAHFCSNWDPEANAHCLRTHPRCGNH